jgi:hypothetical protein
MRRRSLPALLLALACIASRSDGAVTLELRVDAEVRADVAVHVVVKNLGDEAAEAASPETTLAGTTARGDAPATVPPGFTAAWDMTLPRPAALGTLPLVVQLRYADGLGHRMSAPAVHVVRTAGTPPAAITLELETTPVVEAGQASLRITNREAGPVAGTLALVASAELAVTPVERAVDVAAGSTLTVPITIRNDGALPDSAAGLWAALTSSRDGYVDTVVTSAVVPIVAASRREDRPSIAIPLLAAGAGALVLWGARRLVAPARAPHSRADRRRARPSRGP